jgi:endonuclease/exonuclease/phosphatase (EEP) superfamily protein YafD
VKVVLTLREDIDHMPKTLVKSRVLASLCLAGLMVPIATRMHPESEHTLAWLIDLASHRQWVFLGGLILFAAISAWGEKRWAFLLLAVPLPWITASEPAPATASDAPMLKIAAANVGLKNREPDPLLNWLAAQRIDIVALSEGSPAYARKLKSQNSFPFRHIVPRRGPFGLALPFTTPVG